MMQPLFGKDMFRVDPNATPAQIAAKRQLMAMLRPNFGNARYVGEGLGQLATGIAMGAQNRQMDRIEGKNQADANAMFAGVLGGASPMNILGVNPEYTNPNDPAQIGADAMAALGKGGYRDSLIGTESGGNWGAQNNEVGAGGRRGHFGRVQFGQARLQEAMNAGAIPQGMTPEQFMADPQAQMAAENWHFADLEKQLGDLVGTNVNGQNLDLGALVAMGHLGGAAGARRYVETGGRYNPSDAYGTSLSDYARTHGGKGNTALPPVPMDQLIGLMSNLWLAPEHRAMLSTMFDQQVQAGDPMRQIGLEKAQMELDAMRNPAPVEPSFRTLSPQEAEAIRLAPGGVYQVDPKGEISVLQQPPTAVDGNEYGLNPIMGVDKDGNPVVLQLGKDGTAKATVLPEGITADMRLKAYETAFGGAMGKGAGEAQIDAQVALPALNATTEAVRQQIDALKNDPYLDRMLGPIDSLLPNTSEDAARVQGMFDQLQGGAFLQARQLLKGGGAITDFEGQKAEAAFARLNKAQSPEDFKAALDDFLYFVEAGLKKLEGQAQGQGLGSSPAKPAPSSGGTVLKFNPQTGEFE